MSDKLPEDGVASRIVRTAFALQGVRVEYHFFPWARALSEAQTRFDGSVLWLKSAERERDFYYSDPVVQTHYALFHLKSTPLSGGTAADIANMRVGITNGFYYGPAFEAALRAGSFSVDKANDEETNLRKLLAGRIQVVPIMTEVGNYLLKAHFTPKEASQIVAESTPFYAEDVYLLLNRRNPEHEALMRTFNIGLKRLKESGNYAKYLQELTSQP